MTKNNFPPKKGDKKICPYCGNNPVPHFVYWYFESLNLLLAPLRQFVLFNKVSLKIKRFLSKLPSEKFFLLLLRGLGVIRLNSDINACKVERATVLWQEAEKRGMKMKEILLFGRPIDAYVAEKFSSKSDGLGAKSEIIFSGLPRPKNYYNASLDLMDDKGWLKKTLEKHNLPVPTGGHAFIWQQAKKIFEQIQKSGFLSGDLKQSFVIVKPRAGSRGRHSTTYVSSVEELKRAYEAAKKLCFWVMVEEQLMGPVYRATVINYKLRGVLRGDQPQVVGDGIHSISRLVEIRNHRPHIGAQDIVLDEKAKVFLSKQGMMASSVPEIGRSVSLSEKIGVNYGGSSSEDFDICHPDNNDLFERAALIVGDPIVGFDFIIPDITKSFKQQRCGFIEANSLPFINLHHNPLHGKPRNVAASVWDAAGF